MSRPRLYFAYGSNMWPEQMRCRCPKAIAVGPAALADFGFLINQRGVATIREEEGSLVHGVLWRISRDCEESLDLCEGVGEGFYRKERVRVERGDGKVQTALVYIDQRTRFGRPRPGYLARVLRGAMAFDLPAAYLGEILSWQKGGLYAVA